MIDTCKVIDSVGNNVRRRHFGRYILPRFVSMSV